MNGVRSGSRSGGSKQPAVYYCETSTSRTPRSEHLEHRNQHIQNTTTALPEAPEGRMF